MDELFLLLLLVVANGAPLAARVALGNRLTMPLDGGLSLHDGRRLFGASKTVSGLAAGILATAVLAPLVGLSWPIGLLIGGFAMAGDLFSSFIKRRLGLESGAMALGLDQIPESLFPMLACKPLLMLSWYQILWLTLGFMLADLLISRLLYHLGMHHHPH